MYIEINSFIKKRSGSAPHSTKCDVGQYNIFMYYVYILKNIQLEKYLKSSSGYAFTNKRLI